ncbi:MAG: hypothetical protein KJP07_03600, partial [Desulfatitalea sp.]|nr:hypothetical protein [Desulfatitalea sp.]
RLKVVDPAGPDLKEDVAKIQRLFWNSAMAEFQDAMAKHAELFAGVEVVVPDVFVGDLLAQLKREAADIEKAVAKAVTDQSFFNSGDKRRFLKVASSVKITQMMNKLTQEDESSSDSPQALVLLYFELLQKLKRRLEIKQQAIDSIKASYAAITADQLLEVMFQMVFNAMYLPEWPALAPRLYGTSSFLATDVTTYQATM